MKNISDSMVHPNAPKFGLIEGHVVQVYTTEKPGQKAVVFTGVIGCDLDGNICGEAADQLVLFVDHVTVRSIAGQFISMGIAAAREIDTSWHKLRPGPVWRQGCGWMKGKDRITYRLKDGEDNIDYLSISARGKDPFYHVDCLTLEIRDGNYYLQGQLARQEKGIEV
jgi:hypothetical protein